MTDTSVEGVVSMYLIFLVNSPLRTIKCFWSTIPFACAVCSDVPHRSEAAKWK